MPSPNGRLPMSRRSTPRRRASMWSRMRGPRRLERRSISGFGHRGFLGENAARYCEGGRCGMKKLMLTIVLPLIAARAAAADIWQECQIESATMCGHDGCRSVEPTLKLYFGDYRDPAGRSRGYYYRCRRNASCDRIEDPWIGEN